MRDRRRANAGAVIPTFARPARFSRPSLRNRAFLGLRVRPFPEIARPPNQLSRSRIRSLRLG